MARMPNDFLCDGPAGADKVEGFEDGAEECRAARRAGRSARLYLKDVARMAATMEALCDQLVTRE